MNYDLNYNFYCPNQLTDEQFMHALKNIPEGFTSLNLTRNHLGNKSGSQLAELFAAIPKNVTELNLTNNKLDNSARDGLLAQAFAAIPSNITSLNLSFNYFCHTAPENVAKSLRALSNKITSLDLSWNWLGKKQGHGLATLFEGLPAGVRFLDLQHNCLGAVPAWELALAFNKLPKSITSIDLRSNGFHHLLVTGIFMKLSESPFVQTIYLGQDEIEKMNPEQYELLKTIFPNARYGTTSEYFMPLLNKTSKLSDVSNTVALPDSEKNASLAKVGLFANSCPKDHLLHEPLENAVRPILVN